MEKESTSDDGLVSLRSAFPVEETIQRLAAFVIARGLTVFARIDHAANATLVGMELRPTQLVIFGNPVAGTPLMQDRQTAGIDLPVRALAWEDAAGAVWLTYDDPGWLARRHGLRAASARAVAAIEAGLRAAVWAAAGDAAKEAPTG